MAGSRQGRRRSRAVGRVIQALAVVGVAVLLTGITVYRLGDGSGQADPMPRSTTVTLPATSTHPLPHSSARTSLASRATSPASQRSSAHPVPAVVTPEGMWWGVDSSGPITAAAIDNVRGWYQGATPQFWGRYVGGPFAVSSAELAFAREHHIYVYLLINDRNCSLCGGVDVCGNDITASQARLDAREAIREATKVGVKRGAVLFKDIEQIGACRNEPTSAYLDTWYRTLKGTDYRTGFYGNVHQQDYDFPRAYCAARAQARDFAAEVALDMNEDEPRLGAARGTTGPHNAPHSPR